MVQSSRSRRFANVCTALNSLFFSQHVAISSMKSWTCVPCWKLLSIFATVHKVCQENLLNLAFFDKVCQAAPSARARRHPGPSATCASASGTRMPCAGGRAPVRGGYGLGLAKLARFLQIFGGLVLGYIKTKFRKKICVWQHLSSSTRFAYFCTAAISCNLKVFAKKTVWKLSIFRENSAKFCRCRKIAKSCQIARISTW